jgi:hypothetical protein
VRVASAQQRIVKQLRPASYAYRSHFSRTINSVAVWGLVRVRKFLLSTAALVALIAADCRA